MLGQGEEDVLNVELGPDPADVLLLARKAKADVRAITRRPGSCVNVFMSSSAHPSRKHSLSEPKLTIGSTASDAIRATLRPSERKYAPLAVPLKPLRIGTDFIGQRP